MNFDAFPWQHRWLENIRTTVQTHHHAWMLVGREGDGLREAGASLAASLLCETPRDGVACGTCGSCRWIAGDVHPDFVRLAPEESDDEVARLPIIKTDAAREAIAFMELSASTERGRVLLIDPATALSRESANALLKAIEEPPPNTRWILLASRPAKLLPTIRSRTLRLAAPRASTAAARIWLKDQGIEYAVAENALALASGAPLDALAFTDRDAVDLRERFFQDLANPRELPTLSWGSWVEAGGKTGKRARFALLLNLLLEWVTRWTRTRAGLSSNIGGANATVELNVASKLASAEGIRFYRELLRKLALPDTTLSARLQIEAILLEYRAKFS
jgi:DNA polymerase III subunit delta'